MTIDEHEYEKIIICFICSNFVLYLHALVLAVQTIRDQNTNTVTTAVVLHEEKYYSSIIQ